MSIEQRFARTEMSSVGRSLARKCADALPDAETVVLVVVCAGVIGFAGVAVVTLLPLVWTPVVGA